MTINPAAVTLTANSGTKTYTGAAQSVTGFTASVEDLAFAGTVAASGSGTNAGTYNVTFSGVTVNTTRDTTGNYVVTATTNGTLTIEKAAPTVTAPTALTLTYNGKAQALVNAGTTTGGDMQYSLDGKTYAATIPTGTDAKTYTVYYKVIGDANYNVADARTVTATIGKAKATVTAPTAKALTYNGKAQALVNAGTTTGGDMQYSLDGKTFSTTIPTGADAKTYTVYYKVIGDANHKGADAQKVTATIARAAIQPKVSLKGWALGEKAIAPDVTGNTGKGEVTFTYAERGSAEFSATVPTEAGKYTVKASIAETANYLGGEASANFTITKTKPASELPEADFVTPGALKTISDQAFAGIAAVHVRISDKVDTLGSKAFANCKKLQSIYIPESVKTIKDNLLEGCGEVTVYGKSSVVKQFAEKNGFAYVKVK